jgi:hypothetical protein
MSTEPVPLHKNPKFIFAGAATGCAVMLAFHLIENGQFVELIKFIAGSYLAGGG